MPGPLWPPEAGFPYAFGLNEVGGGQSLLLPMTGAGALPRGVKSGALAQLLGGPPARGGGPEDPSLVLSEWSAREKLEKGKSLATYRPGPQALAFKPVGGAF
jgi:hypothetical protein